MLTIYINYTTEYGEAPSQVSVSIEDETEFTFTEEYLPELTADGYQFDGWMLDDRLIRTGDISNVISIDTTFELVAHWTQEKNICGNATGGFGTSKSFVIVDESGNEFTAVVTEDVTLFDATPADVKIGKTFASENGVLTGENTITYRTTKGRQLIKAGESFSIPLSDYDKYNYTKLQCIIAPFNTSIDDSIASDKIALDDYVYPTGSAEKISDITKNTETKAIELNITNDSDNVYFIYYFTYKEEY